MRNLLILYFVCLLSTPALAQKPPLSGTLKYPPKPNTSSCFAGTLWLNTVGIDTIFLCRGDSFLVKHNGDQVFDDPNPSTPSGIAYAFYRCPPTKTGNAANVLTDTCFWPGSIVPSFFATLGPPSGDHWLYNNTVGILNSVIFCNGSPCAITFAPITITDFPNRDLEDGCVDVNINAAFTVVFLKDVLESQIQFDMTDPCSAKFRLRGGTPELDTSATYSVQITHIGDTSVHVIIHTPPDQMKHNTYVEFTAPQGGKYLIEIIDPKGCNRFFQIHIDWCRPSATDAANAERVWLTGAVPNPARVGIPVLLSIQSERFLDISLAVFEMSGRLVFQQNHHLLPGENHLEISTGTLPAGAYVVLLRHENGTQTRRLVLID